MRLTPEVRFGAVICTLMAFVQIAGATQPADQLLPSSTKGFISIPSVDVLKKEWQETQIGKLATDPVMKPFVDDMKSNFKNRMRQTGFRLGVEWEDLRKIESGEVAIGTIQPDNDPNQAASVLIADISNSVEPAKELLAKIDEGLKQEQATKSVQDFEGVTVATYQLPRERGETFERRVVQFVHKDTLVVASQQQIALQLLQRLNNPNPADSLSALPAYQASMGRVEQESKELTPHVRWYIDPLGYARAIRAANGGRKRRGTDILAVLKSQGFDAIQALAGYVNLSTDEHEILHRTKIYAPPVKQVAGETGTGKYRAAARMLDFPNSTNLLAQPWIPRELASYTTFNWKMKDAFEHSKTLVDEIAGDEGFFEDLLSSIKNDPNGPQIDIRNELIAHLDDRATMVSDYVFPITAKSERLLFAVAVQNPDKVALTVHKAFESDPDARQLNMNGHVVWEIINEPDDAVPDLDIDGPGLDLGLEEEEEEEERLLPNSAITVMHGHLLIATHVDFLSNLLRNRPGEDTLGDSVDYRLVNAQLDQLGADGENLRFFTRTDEEYRATYELVRSGKMPESESMLGRLLNRLIGTGEQDVLREQHINGKNLPEFQVVRRYLGPGGLFIRTEDDGWFASGVLLTKQASYDSSIRSAITSARRDKTAKEPVEK